MNAPILESLPEVTLYTTEVLEQPVSPLGTLMHRHAYIWDGCKYVFVKTTEYRQK